MTKVLLVEDDNNLREIFEMRLAADGYQTVTAGNGEEGLTVAMKEKPDLIIADIMMPKLSGFDMIESLRASPEMKDVKVIAMTALGQAEDQARGEKLGVVKYLVKSQATLEDFARVVKEVMPPDSALSTPSGDNQTDIAHNNSNQQESEKKMPDDQTPTMPTNDTPAGNGSSMPASEPVAGSMDVPATPPADSGQMTTAQEQGVVNDQISSFAGSTPPADASSSTLPADEPATMPAPSTTFAPTAMPASEPVNSPYAQPASATDSSMPTAEPVASAEPSVAPAPDASTPPADQNSPTV